MCNGCLQVHLHVMGPWHSICGSCDYEFTSAEDHRKHVDDKHEGKMLLRCGICPEVFPSKFFVDKHRFHDHKGRSYVPKYKTLKEKEEASYEVRVCEVCAKEIPAWGYKKHLSTHTQRENLKLPCPYCGKTLSSASNLDAHIRTHTKPHQCESCGFATATPGQLQVYRKTSKQLNMKLAKWHHSFPCRDTYSSTTLQKKTSHISVTFPIAPKDLHTILS